MATVGPQYAVTVNNATGSTWATITNAQGSTSATFATFTSSVSAAVGTVDCTAYDFSTIPTGSTITAVSVIVKGYVNNTSRMAAPKAQLFDDATAIGAVQTLTTLLSTTSTVQQTWSPSVLPTLAQLQSGTFKCKVTETKAASTQSGIGYLDWVSITVTYTSSGGSSVRTNLATNPRAIAGNGGWSNNDGTLFTVAFVTSGLPTHPQGLTTAQSGHLASGQTSTMAMNLYATDNLANGGVSRYTGLWVYAPVSGYTIALTAGTTWTSFALTGGQWTFVQSAASENVSAQVSIFPTSGGNANSADVFYVTGSISEVASAPCPNFFDGDTTDTATDVYAWTGTAGASTSTDTYTAASGVTGTLATTLDNSVLAATATEIVTGTLATTLADSVLAATGSVTTSDVTGTLVTVLDNSVLAASGSETFSSSMATVLADAVLSASATETITGTLATTLDDSVLAASGTAITGVSGTLNTTLADGAFAASGTETITGTLAASLGDAILAATGTAIIPVTGTLASTLDDAVLAGAGSETVTGTLAVTLDDATLVAVGAETLSGTLTVALDDAVLAATGTAVLNVAGTLVTVLADAGLLSVGTETFTGTLTVTLDDAALLAAGTGATPIPAPLFLHPATRISRGRDATLTPRRSDTTQIPRGRDATLKPRRQEGH